jgi:hypothetical protein
MANGNIIYTSEEPFFAIGVDGRQWLLYRSQKKKGKRKGEWHDITYHPTLNFLLNELAEQEFRDNKPMTDLIGDLINRIERVQQLNQSIGTRLERLL